MLVKVQKWGNSLALRIPKAFAQQVAVEDDAVVDLAVEDGKLVATPMGKQKPSLRGLISQIRDDNLPDEIEFGPPVGKEVW